MWDTPTGAASGDLAGRGARDQAAVQPGQPGAADHLLEQQHRGHEVVTAPASPRSRCRRTRPPRWRRSTPSTSHNNQISGLSTPNSSTIVVHADPPVEQLHQHHGAADELAGPGRDHQLRCPARCNEEQHFISDGPYTITSYTPNVSYTLAKNPAWKQSTDSLRHQYFNAIDITMGENADHGPAAAADRRRRPRVGHHGSDGRRARVGGEQQPGLRRRLLRRASPTWSST